MDKNCVFRRRGGRAKKFHEFISRRLRENWKVNF